MIIFCRGESDLANKLDGLLLPEEALDYCFSLPIIELKLTSQVHEHKAMEQVW